MDSGRSRSLEGHLREGPSTIVPDSTYHVTAESSRTLPLRILPARNSCNRGKDIADKSLRKRAGRGRGLTELLSVRRSNLDGRCRLVSLPFGLLQSLDEHLQPRRSSAASTHGIWVPFYPQRLPA